LTSLTFLLSSATAHAKPGFDLAESSARAGDLVHFSISGVDSSVTYDLEVDGTTVFESTGDGVLSATFTVPDLGDDPTTVTVEADIRGSGKRRKLQRDLEYLGAALPVPDPPAQAPSPAAPVAPPADASAGPSYSSDAANGTSPTAAVTPRPRHPRRKSGKRHAAKPQRRVTRTGERRRRAHPVGDRRKHHAATRKRSKRTARRPVPFFDGFPQPAQPEQHPAPEPTTPRPAVLVATGTHSGGGSRAPFVVPGLFGLAALGLAGTAMLRRRRLASRPRRD
jgi:hypothetical protein